MSFETICCVGDSIANGYWCNRGLGWFGRLQESIATKYPKKFGFNNLAQSGDRTWDAYHRLCSEALTRRPDILIIAIGINDIIRWNDPEGPTDQSAASRGEAWHKLLQAAQKNFEKILVVGLLPNVENRYPCTGWDDKTPMWHKNSDTQAYNTDIKTWCQSRKIPFLDVLDDWLARDYPQFFEDGGHPNGEGHALLCSQVVTKLESLGWTK